MSKKLSYRTLIVGLTFASSFLLTAGGAHAQRYVRTTPAEADMYCSGVITDQPVPNESYVISGEDSGLKTTFMIGDYVYINRGAENGVKVGDQFDVVRAVTDMAASTVWFKYQAALIHAMGTRYADIGRLTVVHVDAKTATTQVSLGCGLVQRGDLVRPFVVRPAPQYHEAKLDMFAPPSGKKMAMIVSERDYSVLGGPGQIVYVNLGAAQGVHVGDYFRVFQYQGTRIESVYQVEGTAYKAYGFGSTPVAYDWNNLPRQILGEGIVLRTGPNSSTVMLTTVRREIHAGNYVEIE